MVNENDALNPAGVDPKASPPSRWKGLLKLGIFILVAQALFWGIFYVPWGDKPRVRNIERISYSSTTLAELDAPTPAAADAATHNKINLPYVDCCDPSYLSLKLTFNMKDIPATGLGLVATQDVDNFIYRINGSIVHQKGRMEFGNQTFHGQKPSLVHIPAGMLKVGDNEISIITVRHGFPYSDLYEPIIGEYTQVHKLTALRFWQGSEYRLLGGALTFVLGLLALVMVFRSQQKLLAFWLLVLCWSWSAYAAYGLVLDLPYGGIGRMVSFFTVTTLVNISLINFIDTWTRRPMVKAQIGLLLIWAAFCGFCFYALNAMPMPSGFDLSSATWAWMLVGGGAIVILRLLWHFATSREDRYVEAALLSICAVCMALDSVGHKFGLNPGAYLIESAAIMLLAFVIAFLQRNFHLFQSTVALNGLLESNLRKREAELAEAHIRERELIDNKARNEERRRLMRDMHDGVGGQLVGLLLEVRRGAIDHARMAEGLQVAMDEIRLMIDSVDASTTTMQTMLSVFENRIRPRIQGAGFAFDFHADQDQDIDLAPPEVLQIFRIMQEAVTNAVKHSGGDRITVEVKNIGCELVVSIRDNGKGIASDAKPEAGGGHGLGNMRSRAQSIGGDLNIGDAHPGTCIRLILPFKQQDGIAA